MNWWDIAVRLDSATKTKYSKDISLAMCEEAELLYKRNYLEEAIALFEKAKETDDKLFEIYKESYSNLLFDYGEDQIIKKELKKGIANLNYSFVLTDVNKIKIENKLNSLKRSKFLSSSLAIIPGLSQFIYQNGLTKPILLFGSFSLCSSLGILNGMRADKYYEDYKNANTPNAAVSLFNKAKDYKKHLKYILASQ